MNKVHASCAVTLCILASLVDGCATTPRTAEVVKACGLEQRDHWHVLRNAPADAGRILDELQRDTPFKKVSTPVEIHAYWLQAEAGRRLAYCEQTGPISPPCGASVVISTTLHQHDGAWVQEGERNAVPMLSLSTCDGEV